MIIEYAIVRNMAVILIAILGLIIKDIEPFEALPESKHSVMLGRALSGFSVALLINQCLELIPLSLMVILYQTSPFWTSILSYLINGE